MDTVKLTGTVVPKPPEDSKVVVQVRYEGQKAWKKVGTATVKPSGNYRFDVEPSRTWTATTGSSRRPTPRARPTPAASARSRSAPGAG